MNNKFSIIGTGAWATAIANVLIDNNVQVKMYGINKQEISDINKGRNTKFFGETILTNSHLLSATSSLDEVLQFSNNIVLAVPSVALDSVTKNIKAQLKDAKINVINVAKGFDNTTGKFLSDIIEANLGDSMINLATFIGPSYAIEVFEKKLTMINVATKNEIYANFLCEIFDNHYFKLEWISNEMGAQIFAALKNVLAIGIGIIAYNNPGKNTHSAMISLGVREILNVYHVMSNDNNDMVGYELSGIGDVFLTCSSTKSRNFSFGQKIAQIGVDQSLKQEKMTIEGYDTAKILKNILENHKVYVPLLKNIIDVLFNGKDPNQILDFLNW